jgi:hypothetical protein
MVETNKLEEVASRLNKKSDSINVTIQKIQDKVNSYNLGLEVWRKHPFLSQDITVGDGAERGTVLEKFLGYTKFSDKWSFAYREREAYYQRMRADEWERIGDSTVGDPIPLLKASREIRIASLKDLQYLIDEMYNEAKKALEAIDKARKLADEL